MNMESVQESLPSVIQYYKGSDKSFDNSEGSTPQNNFTDNQQSSAEDSSKMSSTECEIQIKKEPTETNEEETNVIKKDEKEEEEKPSTDVKEETSESVTKTEDLEKEIKTEENIEDNIKKEAPEDEKQETVKSEPPIPEKIPKKRGRKRKHEIQPVNETPPKPVEPPQNNGVSEEEEEEEEEEEDEIEVRPRKRGRCKKNPDIIPPHLSSDNVLGFKILLKFLETPQFTVFHKPLSGTTAENSRITCLNQIKRKFEDNAYKKISEFVNDVREMLTNIYESRNTLATKRALRLEQILEQRIAQLPNYLRPQCALVLSPDDLNNSHNKIRINKGGGFVSLLLEKAEKRRCDKDKEKRKLLAEERKQLKEEQDKDVQEWEKNVLLKDHEEEIKSMWELPAIGHFIHLCTDILNIGEVAQYEVERMLLMPQCSETLDLIMTALLSNSLVRAKLDRTPSMPYSIWAPLVTTRVVSWYRAWQREGRNEYKVFEEIGVEPDFWKVLGPDVNPLDYYLFHELNLLQRVWVLKTLCDVDFVRKKTVYDNIRAQTLDELNPVNLGVDRHGNRYIQLKQFCGPDMRIYRQCANLENDFSPADLIESIEGFEYREGPITTDKVFKDIWDVGEKSEVKLRRKKNAKVKKTRVAPKVNNEVIAKKNLRQSARAKQKSYVIDSSESDTSDTDLATLKSKLRRSDAETLYRPFSDKEFISLSVFRLPREKVTKPATKKNSYVPRKFDCGDANDKCKADDKKDVKPSGFEDEASDSLDLKQMQDMQVDFEKNFQMDDINEDDLSLESKLDDFSLEKCEVKDKFTVKNLDDLKMVLKKGSSKDQKASPPPAAMNETGEPLDAAKPEEVKEEKTEDSTIEMPVPPVEPTSDTPYKYDVPDHLKPDSNKFYLVVDSVDGLRQLISKFASHENDLEIISRSTKSKRNSQSTSSCEVQLIERLQNLLVELEPWEWDLIKSSRLNREKMYKEYMNFLNRPADFVHPNESYWMKFYEEPVAPPNAATTGSNIGTVEASSADKGAAKEKGTEPECTEPGSSQPSLLEELAPRKRTRVTRLQLKLDEQDDLDEELGEDDTVESSESDDNWELPASLKKKVKRESAVKITRPKKSVGRRSRVSNVEKAENQSVIVEKSTQSPGADKAKKALFWGPRSSDPSEDLNWETNRQKILEKHNSPKKALFKGEEGSDEKSEMECALPRKAEKPVKSVITSPKRYLAPIPGNKKPYFSSAQLKAMEDQAKQQKSQGDDLQFIHPKISKTFVGPKGCQTKTGGKPLGESSLDVGSEVESPAQVRLAHVETLSNNIVNSNIISSNSGLKNCGNNNNNVVSNLNEKLQMNQQTKATPSVSRTVPTSFGESINSIQTVIATVDPSGTSFQQPAKIIQQIKKPVGQSQQPGQKTDGQVQYQAVNQVQKLQAGGQLIQIQKPIGQIQEIHQQGNQTQSKPLIQQIHVQQPIGQITQVQIPQSISQIHPTFIQTTAKDGSVSLSNIRVHQPVHIQSPSVITVGQPVQIQNQTIQIQAPRVATIQQPVQVQGGKVGPVQQPVQTSQAAFQMSENDLYLTDGTVLIKADNNFVQQFMQKDKILTLNVNDKLDFKKPLFIVKPKLDSSPAQTVNNVETSTNQPNLIVFNKPPAVQQGAIPTSVTNIVIPSNYIVSDSNIVQTHMEPSQNVVVQQNPTFIIRQKPVANKGNQPQVIKIIDSQTMTPNQNVILSPQNIKFANQVIGPVNQSVITSEQSKPAPTLRFIRPSNVVSATQSVIQNKMSTIQNSKTNVNSVVQVQTPRFEVPKTQTSVITSKIVPTNPVAGVRMNAPLQPQQIKTVASATSTAGAQPVRFAVGNNIGGRVLNRPTRPTKPSVITSTAPAPVAVVTSVRSPVTTGQSVRLQSVNLQPSTIKPGQNRLQLTPTKILARASTPLTSPIIIKLNNPEEIGVTDEKSVSDQPLTVDFVQGDLSVKETNQGWMYVVKTPERSDMVLTNEQLEEKKAANNAN